MVTILWAIGLGAAYLALVLAAARFCAMSGDE